MRIIGTSFLSEGTALGYDLLARASRRAEKTYGRDWVYLGFRPQYVAAILGLGESIGTEFPEDYLGTPTSELTLMESVKSYADVKLVLSIADDTMPQYWIEYANARYGVEVAAGYPTLTPLGPQPRIRRLPLHGTFASGKIEHRLRIAVPLADADPNGGFMLDKTIEAFSDLYPTNHKFYGFMDYFTSFPGDADGFGLQDIIVQVSAAPMEGAKFGADC